MAGSRQRHRSRSRQSTQRWEKQSREEDVSLAAIETVKAHRGDQRRFGQAKEQPAG